VRRPAVTWLLLCGLVLSAYGPILHGVGLIYEDTHWWSEIWTPVTLAPTWDLAHWSLSLNAWLGGGFHLTNVLIHCLNGWLVFVLVRRLLLREWSARRWRAAMGLGLPAAEDLTEMLHDQAAEGERMALPALIACAAFLLHPIQTEAVAYLSSRWELVSTSLLLLACVAPWPLALIAGVLAMTTKASAMVVVLLLILVRGDSVWGDLLVFPALLVSAMTLYADRFGRLPYLFLSPYGIIEYAARQAVAIWRMLALVVVPWGQTVDHDWINVPGWAVALAIPALLGSIVEVYRRRQTHPLLWLSACWILLALAPRFVIRAPEFVSEHHMYAPMVGVALLVGSWGRS